MPRRSAPFALALVAVFAAFVVPSTAQSQPPKKISVPYTMFTLPNGLTVILHEDHTVPLVSVNMWYHAGSGREKPGRTGFGQLFEHLMFEGSKHVKESEFDTLLTRRRAVTTTDRPTPIGPTTGSVRRRAGSSWRSSSSRTAWATCSTLFRPNSSTASGMSSRTNAGRAS